MGKQRKNTRRNRGITLIALVITIVILLILAGISIAQLTGTGIFAKAKEAKAKYKNAEELENQTLAEYERLMNELGGSSQSGSGGKTEVSNSFGNEDKTDDGNEDKKNSPISTECKRQNQKICLIKLKIQK